MISCPSCRVEHTETSAFCSACGAALRAEFGATVAHPAGDSPADSGVHSSRSDSSNHGRFLPGTKVADRYRIVSLAGKGGMGEVYRADDLKLGHTVALKFLPRDLANDPQRLEYFHSEVRLTRQISHPNVCRVYDIGEVDGQHFLSMEYIDGEDLKALLRRIGRLPKDKGIQIAQQLCAGLAAAHERDVLHRDLKPANIMVDGRGQVRITDFGLAKLADDGAKGEVAGTPAYMAPEQLSDGTTTVQSDVYSLGLILYEVFTGKAVHKTSSIPELIRAHSESSPSQPSNLIDDMDPAVERVILRCLEREPHQRPKSANTVAAALPGGDPLAAALAAGETPSPEMVAAAGETGELSLKVGIALLSVVCALLVALPILASWLDKHQLSRLRENEPAVLRNDAARWIKRLGHTTPAEDTASLFAGSKVLLYRQSSRPFHPRITRLFGGSSVWWVTPDNPSVLEPGMITVRLDPSKQSDSGEQLLEFLAVLETDDSEKEAQITSADKKWDQYFQVLRLDPGAFSSVAIAERPENWRPPIYVDDVSVWRAVDSAEMHVTMAVRNNRLVYFRRMGEADEAGEPSWLTRSSNRTATGFLTVVAVVFSGLLALRNLKLGRTDARGGLRFAVYYFAVEIVLGIIVSHHPSHLSAESVFAANYLIYALARSLRVWLYYVGFEPYVRRLWPVVLITWSRVLSGRFRDPLVGRDLMIGCLFAVLFAFTSELIDDGPPNLNTNLRASYGLGTVLVTHQLGLLVAFTHLAILLLCRVLVQKTWLAAAVFTVVVTLNQMLRFGFDAEVLDAWILNVIFHAGLAILYVRFGLLAVIVCQCSHTMLLRVTHTADFGAWYALASNYALVTVLLVACYGFCTSTLAPKLRLQRVAESPE